MNQQLSAAASGFWLVFWNSNAQNHFLLLGAFTEISNPSSFVKKINKKKKHNVTNFCLVTSCANATDQNFNVYEYLSLDDIPGVLQTNIVFWVVQREAVFQILLGILTDLKQQRGQE